MFRPTDRQMPLFSAEAGLGESARARLSGTWAEHFRSAVMPLLLDAEVDFAQLYPPKGRPNWSVACLLGVCLLQNLRDFSDQEAVDALAFDIRWQHALGLGSEDSYLSRRSLVAFRQRLVEHDPRGELLRMVFDRVMAAGIADLKISVAEQRVDSTLICSDIRNRGRLSLARETIRVFLNSLQPEQLKLVPDEICAYFEAQDSNWEIKLTTEESRSRLHQAGGWLSQLAALFADDILVTSATPYQLLIRMLVEHADALGIAVPQNSSDEDDCDGPESGASASNTASLGDSKKKAKSKGSSRGSAARYWSAHDPDASCGHKGLGYHAHFTETCNNDTTELLTDYDLKTAAIPDVGQAQHVAKRLHARGIGPTRLYADGGYPTPSNLVSISAMGTVLEAPVHRGKMDVEAYSRTDFSFDLSGDNNHCPQGHSATRLALRVSEYGSKDSDTLFMFFDAETCSSCDRRSLCPVRTPNNKRSRETRLEISEELLARDKRWAEQKTEAWHERYRIRSGVEATMAELKKAHGLAQLRVRGHARVLLQVALKATACNLKRWHRAGRGVAREALRSLLIALGAITSVLPLRGINQPNDSISPSLASLAA